MSSSTSLRWSSSDSPSSGDGSRTICRLIAADIPAAGAAAAVPEAPDAADAPGEPEAPVEVGEEEEDPPADGDEDDADGDDEAEEAEVEDAAAAAATAVAEGTPLSALGGSFPALVRSGRSFSLSCGRQIAGCGGGAPASSRANAQRLRFGCDAASPTTLSSRVFFRPDVVTCS